MRVLKFGGTSVGSANRMKQLLDIIPQNEEVIVVLSAMSGTTNILVEIAKDLCNTNIGEASKKVDALKNNYKLVIDELEPNESFQKPFQELVKGSFDTIGVMLGNPFSKTDEKVLLAQGELLSTGLFHQLLKRQHIDAQLLPALTFMRINECEEPDMDYITSNLKTALAKIKAKVHITQGFICMNHLNEVDNLRRGGSDYTASIIGAAIDASVVEIWTDISGFHNNDPRVVENTESLKELAFEEAAELAYFGAKILHPSSVLPAKKKNIPVLLKNTLEPNHPGTKIHGNAKSKGVRAIAAKDGITMINIRSGRMLLAYGFLRKVFEVFEQHKTPIDMITTSEVAVSLTIDNDEKLEEIQRDLAVFGEITLTKSQCIVAVVGQIDANTLGLAGQIFNALKEVPIHMISYGGSKFNVSVLVDESNKKKALNDLSTHLLKTAEYVA
jgi:aspartate kinase